MRGLIAGVPLLILAGLMNPDLGRFVTDSGSDDSVGASTPDSKLLSLLDSPNGTTRMKATAEILHRGKSMLAPLQRAGAKPMATIDPPRRDVLYSLLKGNAPDNYRADSFGIHFSGPVSRADVERLGTKYGFVLPATESVDPLATPSCYVKLAPGKVLFEVLRSVLRSEPAVVTVNLNYVEN
jgi:hypothetical protein